MTGMVVTGIGVVSPNGVGTEQHWTSVLRGDLRTRVVPEFADAGYPCVLAGLADFAPEQVIEPRLQVQTDRWTWHCVAATSEALADAGYDPADYDPYRTSVFLASGSGGNEFGQREIERLWRDGREAVGVYQSIAWFYAASTGQVSIKHGTKGASAALVSEGAGGLDSIGWARRALRRGSTAALVGGTESAVSPYALVCQATHGELSTARSPAEGYKPFDRQARGHIPGEGGGVLLVEDPDTAKSRGIRGYGEIAGYGATQDAHHVERAAPDCAQLARAMTIALADANLRPDEIDLVVADGAGTRERDALEVAAIHQVFGDSTAKIPITAPQGLSGRMMAGGSALSVVIALLAIRDGVIPVVGNLDQPVPEYGLDFVRGEPRHTTVRTALISARGRGGFNAALVVRARTTG
jgi:minimal PKS chain-length factor (CLF/KS beta)